MSGLNVGHGHVFPRADGHRMRCGGPGLCHECSRDKVILDRSRDPETVAQWFHEAYERLAPQHSYSTRKASAKPWSEVPENNRALMVATVAEVLRKMEDPR